MKDNFVKHHMFPGSDMVDLPSLIGQLETAGFRVETVREITQDFAKTVSAWRDRFNSATRSGKLNLDPSLRRTWAFYLGLSEAAFLAGANTAFQLRARAV